MKREYRAQGRYGQTWVDEFREGSSGTWGDSLGPFTRKVGQSVANKLNEAYAAGVADADRTDPNFGDVHY